LRQMGQGTHPRAAVLLTFTVTAAVLPVSRLARVFPMGPAHLSTSATPGAADRAIGRSDRRVRDSDERSERRLPTRAVTMPRRLRPHIRQSATALGLLFGAVPAVGAQSSPDTMVAGEHVGHGRTASVQFLVGAAHLGSVDAVNGVEQSRWGTAVGLRVGFPANGRLRFDTDVRLQVAGLRGPCTRAEEARRQCTFEADTESLGDLAISFGASFAPTRWMRASALVSPRLSTRGIDRVTGAEHVNLSAHPWSAALGLDIAIWRATRLHLEYRAAPTTTYTPDSQSIARLGALPTRLRSRSIAAALLIPLGPRLPRGVSGDSTQSAGRMGSARPAWTSFGLVIENDLPWRDEAYTNGLRAFATEVPVARDLLRYAHLGWQRHAVACPYGGRAVPATTPFCRVTQVAITQTMHTPVAIYHPEPLPDDRPFSGTLFGSTRSDLLRPGLNDRSFLSIGSEIQLGVMGPAALSEQTQSMAHWLIATGAARPAGWPNQAPNRLHAASIIDAAYRGHHMSHVADPHARAIDRLFNSDVTLRANAVLGTTHRSASAGVVGRWSPLGRRLPLTTHRAIVPTKVLVTRVRVARDSSSAVVTRQEEYASPRDVRFALLATLDGRLVGHNQTLVGTDVTPRGVLYEVGTGVQFERSAIAITGAIIHRSREYSRPGEQARGLARYWTAQITYRPSIEP
jgi:hypothetical protein